MLRSALKKLCRALPGITVKSERVAAPTRLPERGSEISWMKQSVAYFRQSRPSEAHLLFRRGSPLYMPAILSVVCGFRGDHLAAYRQLQRENPDLVSRARHRGNDRKVASEAEGRATALA